MLPTQQPVRMNTTSILREDAMFRKQQQKDAELLKEYEKTLHDSRDFDKWKEKEEMKEELEKVEEIRKRKDEMVI